MGSAATDLVATVSADTAGLEAAILPATSVVMAGMADIAATDGAGVVFIRPSASTPTPYYDDYAYYDDPYYDDDVDYYYYRRSYRRY